MVYLTWFFVVFVSLRLVISVVNFLSKSYPKYAGLKSSPLLSVLIPARNEEQNIGTVLDDLTAQDYQSIEILVYDDLSEDNTADMVKAKSQADPRIRCLSGKPLPEGWNGKNHACHLLSLNARGDYLLFVDADVRIGNGLFRNALSMAKKNKLQLLSIFPTQEMKTFGEKITVPVMNWILTSLLPLPMVLHSKKPSLAAANGQFMLFEKENYFQHQWHKTFRKEKAEDIAIMKAIKRKGYRGQTLLGDKSVRCRMYSGYHDAIEGFSKNVNAYFGNSYAVAFGFALIVTFGFLVVGLNLGAYFLAVYLLISAAVKAFTAASAKQPVILNVLLFPLQIIALWVMLIVSLKNSIQKSHQWKGRKIS